MILTVQTEGLEDKDILTLLKLLRAETDENVLSIRSEDNYVHVVTGQVSGPLSGHGLSFEFERTPNGWEIRESAAWMS